MKTPTIVLALSLAFLAACDRADDRRPASAGSSAAPANTANTEAPTRQSPTNMGAPSAAEKAEGRNPQQGQVDPKQAEQHRDFKHPATGGK